MTNEDGTISITDEQRKLPLTDLLVEDGIILIQMIERLAKSGVAGAELYPMGVVRERVVKAIQAATDDNTTELKE